MRSNTISATCALLLYLHVCIYASPKYGTHIHILVDIVSTTISTTYTNLCSRCSIYWYIYYICEYVSLKYGTHVHIYVVDIVGGHTYTEDIYTADTAVHIAHIYRGRMHSRCCSTCSIYIQRIYTQQILHYIQHIHSRHSPKYV
jgi:hypothetical protein